MRAGGGSGRLRGIGFVAMLAVTSCGGARAGSTASDRTISNLTRFEEMGRTDPARLACSIVSLPMMIQAVPGTPASNVRALRGSNRVARSAQGDMSSRDAVAAALRAGMPPGRAEAEAARAVAADQRAVVEAEGAGDARRPERPPTDEGRRFTDYASLWATLLTTPDDSGDVSARLAEIDEIDPDIAETYAGAVLYVADEWELSCGGSEP